ncbi:MAG: hypothetical protein HY905_04800 [Deltaproteobacteria bacterium]|nr:hypothetical protein [Deltaproteobacteria bacterium]
MRVLPIALLAQLWAARVAADAAADFPPLPAELQLSADRLTLDLDDGTLDARDVSLTAPGVALAADEAFAELEAGRYRLLGVRLRLELPEIPAVHGAAEELEVDDGGATARDGALSRCPLETAGWRLEFGEACAEANGDVVVRSAVLRIGEIPVFGSPWALLRFGRLPGLRPLEVGARERRGPFLRVAAVLPAGSLGDFELAVTGFPMDDVDVAASWLGPYGRIDLGVADTIIGPHGFLRTDVAKPIGTLGAIISRGIWGQPGFRPAGVVETSRLSAPTGFTGPTLSTDSTSSTRFPSLRADRFAMLGGDFWTAAVGLTTWQRAVDGVVEAGETALPRLRFGWSPGALDDALCFPGAARLGLWRPLGGLLIVQGDTSNVLALDWRQSIEVALPGIPGLDLRPFVASAGRRDVAGGAAHDFVWLAAGARALLAAERSWDGGEAYHRFGIELRYARILPVDADAIGEEALLGPGPDLLRVGFPQVLRLGDAVLSGDAWIELRRLDGWSGDAATFGARLDVAAPWLDLGARFAMDGDGAPIAAAADAVLDAGGPVELLVRYTWLDDAIAGATAFLPWEERLATMPSGLRVVRHGLGGDVVLRSGGDRVVLRVGAEADLDAPALAAIRVGLSFNDPARCLGLDLGAVFWLDQPIPNVAVALRL